MKHILKPKDSSTISPTWNAPAGPLSSSPEPPRAEDERFLGEMRDGYCWLHVSGGGESVEKRYGT
jgi:hypothetical protein